VASQFDTGLALEREAVKTQRLSHPNIVNVYDFDQHDDQFYLVMEWLEGESVNALLRRTSGHRLEPHFSWQLIQSIAAGLQHAHSNDVVHADINPSNIFITDTQEIKLLDFGVARDASDAEDAAEDGPIWATRTYASPEVLSGSTPTFEDDIFSLACVGYRLLSGTHPFAGLSSVEAEQEGITVQPIPGLSQAHWQVLKGALSFARTDRPNSASVFLDDYSAATGSGFAARVLGQPPGRWPAVVVPIAAIALLGGLWWLSQSGQQDEPPAVTEAVPLGDTLNFEADATEAKATIESLELEELLGSAAQAIAEERFVTPADDNARNMYREVLAIDAANSTAINGLRAISDVYVQHANIALRSGAPAEAIAALAIADGTDPLNPGIAMVNELLLAQGNGQLAKAQMAATAGNTEKAIELLSDAERYAYVDVNAIDAVRRQIAQSTAERQFLDRLAIADAHITAGRLLAPAGENAYALLIELRQDHQDDPRLLLSMERLAERLLAGAAFASVAERYPEASELLDAAGGLGVLAPEVSAARLSLQRAMEEATNPVIAADDPPEARFRTLSDLGIEKFVAPRYPRNAKRRGLAGFVEVRFNVNVDGSTGEIESVRAEPGDVFASSAKDAVRKWRFAPRDDVVTAQVTLSFELDP